MVKHSGRKNPAQYELGQGNGGLGDKRERRQFRPKNPQPITWKWFPINENYGVVTYYSGWYDVHRGVSKLIGELAVGKAAHAGYLAGHGRGGSIELILMENENISKLSRIVEDASYYIKIHDSKDIINEEHNNKETDKNFGIRTEILKGFSGLSGAIMRAVRSDVVDYCKNPYNKERWGKEFDDWAGVFYVDKFVPKTKANIITLKPNNFIIRRGKGQHKDHLICGIKVATEFGRGCLSNLGNDGTYNPDGRCRYCYGKAKNSPFFLKYVYDSNIETIANAFENRSDFVRKGERVLWRLGITTDPFIPSAIRKRWGLPNFLEKCLLTAMHLNKNGWDISPIVLSKYPEFDPYMAELLIKSNARLFGSVGLDCFEEGAAAWGFDTKNRLRNIIKYKKAGVDAGISLVTDMRKPIKGRWENDPLESIIRKCSEKEINLMIIGLRAKNPEVVYAFTGESKSELKRAVGGQMNLEGETMIGYRIRSRYNAGEVVHEVIHPDFKELVRNSKSKGKVGLCSSPGGEEACCGCFVHGRFKQVITKSNH